MKTKVVFKSNLDEVKRYLLDLNREWDGDIYPLNGERITYDKYNDGQFTFELEVKSVTFKNNGTVKEIELHIPSYYSKMSLNDWSDWFNSH